MKILVRIVPWSALFVTVYQIAVYVSMLVIHPALLVTSIVAIAMPLGIGLAFFALDDVLSLVFKLPERTPVTTSRRALGWMMLSCIPAWPVLILQSLDLHASQWTNIAIVLAFVAAAVRYLHEDGLLWSVPLILGVASVCLSVTAHAVPGCMPVALVLILHAVAQMRIGGTDRERPADVAVPKKQTSTKEEVP